MLSSFCLAPFPFFFWDCRVALCSPGLPGTHYINQAELAVILLSSDTRVLGLQTGIIMLSFPLPLKKFASSPRPRVSLIMLEDYGLPLGDRVYAICG